MKKMTPFVFLFIVLLAAVLPVPALLAQDIRTDP